MANPLPYTPIAQPEETAGEALARLLDTLHETGTLRVVEGLVGRLDAVSDVALKQLDTPEGRNLISNVLTLVQSLTALDADNVAAFVEGTDQGLRAARESLKREPPTLLGLFGALKDENVRRGLNAVLVLLGTLGKRLHQNLEA